MVADVEAVVRSVPKDRDGWVSRRSIVPSAGALRISGHPSIHEFDIHDISIVQQIVLLEPVNELPNDELINARNVLKAMSMHLIGKIYFMAAKLLLVFDP